jgi:uncharacterized protein YnzC (UPF0291/DUF896 family)
MTQKHKRGEDLKKLIKEGINHLANKNKDYQYNASELARHINTSRVTLNKYSDYIDDVLNEIKIDKKGVGGNGMVQHLLDRIEMLEQENKEIKQERDNLKINYIEIFQKMYENSENINKIVDVKKER